MCIFSVCHVIYFYEKHDVVKRVIPVSAGNNQVTKGYIGNIESRFVTFPLLSMQDEGIRRNKLSEGITN